MPPTVGSAADAIRAALSAIVGTGEEVKKVLQTLAKVLSNIDKSPQDLKFRVLKLTNKTVSQWLLPFPGAMVLLDAVGFDNDGLVLSLPLDHDMPLLRQAILAVDDRLRRIHVRWVSCLHPDARTDALRLGSTTSGMALHIGRSHAAEFGGGMQLGAISSADGKFSTSFGGEVVSSDDYEVLCCAMGGAIVAPQPASAGRIPVNALAGGWEADGTPLYVALCPLPGFSPNNPVGLVPGKVRTGFGAAACASAGQSHETVDYFVLSLANGAVLAEPSAGIKPPTRRFLVSIAELLAWSPAGVKGVDLDMRVSEPLPPPLALAEAQRAPRVMHCHDMQGGYCELADETYRAAFGGWAEIDEFCYFGHHRVCIPPAQWVEDCHANAVPCYGVLLTEHSGGALENAALLDNAVAVAEQLAAMLDHYGFDGWLVNIEAPLPGGIGDMTRLCGFLGKLREACRARCAMARVIIYDSLSARGHVEYSNALSPHNKPMFDACDGIFLNYWWNPGNEQRPTLLKQSRELATAARRIDVYAGIDVFARDRPRLSYDAGHGCTKALEEVASCGLSVALFAPGWTLENGKGASVSPEVAEAEFWEALGSSVASVKASKT